MDQIVEVTGHSPSESIHHKVHLFFHHLHLCNNLGWSRISDGWTARVLSFWFAWGITTLQPLLISSFSTGTFLVLLLNVVPRVPMTRLLFQIVVLLSKALHSRSESLNLSLEGSCPWFVSLNVVSSCHQESEYHATLCLRSLCMAYKSQSFPQIVPTDDAEKSPMSHTVLVCSQQQLHNKKKRPYKEHPVWCQPNTLRMSN